MRVPELRVQQQEAAGVQALYQVDEALFRRVRAAEVGAGEHRLTHERAAEMHAVQAADELIVEPGFNRVGPALFVQLDVGSDQAFVDPRFVFARARRGG